MTQHQDLPVFDVIGSLPIRDAVTGQSIEPGGVVRLDPSTTILSALLESGAIAPREADQQPVEEDADRDEPAAAAPVDEQPVDAELQEPVDAERQEPAAEEAPVVPDMTSQNRRNGKTTRQRAAQQEAADQMKTVAAAAAAPEQDGR